MTLARPDDIPTTPGVYCFADPSGHVLYVGKAKNLEDRLGSYFSGQHHPRTARMLAAAASVTWTVCASETEALVLERDRIRALQPPYNIRLRHGGGYPGLAVTRGDTPRVLVWRDRRPSGTDTFGPYPGVGARELLDAVMVTFGVRSCDDATLASHRRQGRPCLLGETGRCQAPCLQGDHAEEHADAVVRLRRFLRSPDLKVVDRLEQEMRAFADAENFEGAARKRDQIAAFGVMTQRQRIAGGGGWDRRAVAVARNGRIVACCDVRVVDGVVSGVDIRRSEDDPLIDDSELLHQALDQLSITESGPVAIAEQDSAGARRPRGRRERDLLAFARAQAEEALRRPTTDVGERSELAAARESLRELLGLERLLRVECIDISHLGGGDAFGSVVVFAGDAMVPGQYRVVGLGDSRGDDYAAIGETVRRRLSGRRMGLPDLPDLLVIDGGPAQLAAALQAAHDVGVDVTMVSLAKRFEDVWVPGQETPIRLGHDEPALRLLTLLRDSTHDNGLRAHRRTRERKALRTGLDAVPGLGPKRRRALLGHFSTVDAVSRADVSELAGVPGIGEDLARRIRRFFDAGSGDAGTTDMTAGTGEGQ